MKILGVNGRIGITEINTETDIKTRTVRERATTLVTHTGKQMAVRIDIVMIESKVKEKTEKENMRTVTGLWSMLRTGDVSSFLVGSNLVHPACNLSIIFSGGKFCATLCDLGTLNVMPIFISD